MNIPLGVSGSLFGTPTADSYLECGRANISHVEICFAEEWKNMSREALRAELAKQYEWAGARNVRLWSMHLPFGYEEDPSSPNETIRLDTLKRNIERIKAADGFGIGKVVIHASYEPISAAEREGRIGLLRDSLKKLADEADKHQMQIALEDLPRTCIGNTIAEMRRIMDGLDGVGICCDTNHLLFDKTEDFISAFGSRIVTTHISDYDRVNERHWFPGKGINDWNAILKALENTGYQGPALYELGVKDPAKRPTCDQIRLNWDGIVAAYRR